MGTVVNESQAGFIPGRSIPDNILLASELIKGYSRKHISPRCTIKIDLRKAYDSLQWSFLKTMLHELVSLIDLLGGLWNASPQFHIPF